MTPEQSSSDPRQQLEVRITALLLGELPPDQSAELLATIQGDPELSALYHRLKVAVELTKDAAGEAEPAERKTPIPHLEDSRRQVLLTTFKTLRGPNPRRRIDRAYLSLVALAASLVGLLTLPLLLAEFAGPKSTSLGFNTRERYQKIAEGEVTRSAIAPNEEQRNLDEAAGSRRFLSRYGLERIRDKDSSQRQSLDRLVSGGSAVLGEALVAANEPQQAPPAQVPATPAPSGGAETLREESKVKLFLAQAEPAPGAKEATSAGVAGRPDAGAYFYEADAKSIVEEKLERLAEGTEFRVRGTLFQNKGFGDFSTNAQVAGRDSLALGDHPALGRLLSALPDGGASPALGDGVAKGEQQGSYALGKNNTLGWEVSRVAEAKDANRAKTDFKKLEGGQAVGLMLADQDGQDLSLPSVQPSPGAASPLPEFTTADNRFSTFSLNVASVSFQLAAASLEQGRMPEPATIRPEEFLNAFNYRDLDPAPGTPIAFAWERARTPFAHNRELLRFSVKTGAEGRQAGRPLHVVALLDNSGSMDRPDRVLIVQEAFKALVSQLKPQDKLSILLFARTPRLWADGVSSADASRFAEQLGTLTPQGGTNLEEAMTAAYEVALRHFIPGGVNRVVLLTDGAANLGNVDPTVLRAKVEMNRKRGVALDCFGIGWEGYNDELLETLSRNGDGRYGFIKTPTEAETEFAARLAGALRVAASDVKVQVEFNPDRVTSYRQIGYERHQLSAEQFRDNTVDAAEIGAAESGNALYSLEVKPNGFGPLAVARVRYRVPGTTEYHEIGWPVPYEGQAPPVEQTSPAMRLAVTATSFAEWLASSPFAGEVNPDRLLAILGNVPELFSPDPEPAKLGWMIRQAKSATGQ